MTSSKKTVAKKEFLTPGQMKSLAITAGNSVPTKMSKKFAYKLEQNNYLDNKLKAFWKELLAEDQEIPESLSFVMGEVFRHRDPNCVPQYHGDNAKNWIFEPNKDRTISVEINGKLSEFILPKNMNDSEIQTAAKLVPMTEDTFLIILYLLIIKPELGKEMLNYELRKDKVYVFHVKLNSGKAGSVSVYWRDDKWYVFADGWDERGYWDAGSVYLSFATA